jgi:hypothetical protein
MQANSDVLLAAVDALSAAQLAVDKKNHTLINRSRSLYGTALSQMLCAIQDPVMALKDETLLSTYLLTLYEVGTIVHTIARLYNNFNTGFRWYYPRPWLLLPCPGPSTSVEAARAIVVPE